MFHIYLSHAKSSRARMIETVILCVKPYTGKKVLHGLFFVVIFEVLCGTCGGGILIMRLCLFRLFRFLCLKIFNVCAVKLLRDESFIIRWVCRVHLVCVCVGGGRFLFW